MLSLSVQGKLLMLLFHLRMWSFSEDESLETWKFNQGLIWEIAISMLSKDRGYAFGWNTIKDISFKLRRYSRVKY